MSEEIQLKPEEEFEATINQIIVRTSPAGHLVMCLYLSTGDFCYVADLPKAKDMAAISIISQLRESKNWFNYALETIIKQRSLKMFFDTVCIKKIPLKYERKHVKHKNSVAIHVSFVWIT